MNTSTKLVETASPIAVRVAKERLIVDLADGRTISVPLAWYPRLAHGTPSERRNFKLNYAGIHWPDLDEDISVEGLLAARRSGESSRSLRRWLRYREQGQKVPIQELPLPPGLEKTLERILGTDRKKKLNGSRRRAG